jgi:hypothetical protein
VIEANILSSMWQDDGQATPVSAVDDTVGYWEGQTASAVAYTQATAGRRPLYKEPDGYPCVEADGVDDYLRASFTLVQPYWVMGVFEILTWVNTERLFGGGTIAGGHFMMSGSDPDLVINSGTLLGASGEVSSGKFIASIAFNGANSSIRINRGPIVTGNAGTTDSGGMTLFSRNLNDKNSNARIFALSAGAGSIPSHYDEVITYLADANGVAL